MTDEQFKQLNRRISETNWFLWFISIVMVCALIVMIYKK